MDRRNLHMERNLHMMGPARKDVYPNHVPSYTPHSYIKHFRHSTADAPVAEWLELSTRTQFMQISYRGPRDRDPRKKEKRKK